MRARLTNLWNNERAQHFIDYALLLVFVTLMSAFLFLSAGGSFKSIWTTGHSHPAPSSRSAT
ncbi:MAG: hypothetical protein LAP87_23000 [Acidobacteriia bacterium]|nr:hypothetical protein [Terriglobia bacterium]